MTNVVKVHRDEYEEGIKLCYEYANYLIEGAEILRDQDKHSTARVLALHAAEELGKAYMLLDEMERGQPFIRENRWDDKYRDHEHKLRQAHLAVQKNVVKITEWEATISLHGSGSTKKVITEGEQVKRYAEYDVENKFRSLYVDHGLLRGLRGWISPLASTSFYTDAKIEISFARACVRAVQIEAEKHGITL